VGAVDFRLCLVTDRRAGPAGSLVAVVETCLGAGLRAVQLREKDLPAGALFRLAGELRALTWRFGARLLVNDRLDVAVAVGADGLHLPADGLPPAAARRVLGHDRLLGASVHAAAEASAAGREGADYVFFGPVYETPSKRAYGPPRGLDGLAEACARSPVPVLAIGGVTAERVADVARAGAAGVAVIRPLLEAGDPDVATKELLGACALAWP
jgi:thiamine-phosphate pyrophosphorylase